MHRSGSLTVISLRSMDHGSIESDVMRSGRNIQLTRQIGEHLVAAKLGGLAMLQVPLPATFPCLI